MESKSLELFEFNNDGKGLENKEAYLRNELSRMSKENTSLRVFIYLIFQLELNYIYEKLREDNKIHEIKEDILIKKSTNPTRDNLNSNSNHEPKLAMKKSKTVANYNSIASANANGNYVNPIVVFKVKNEKKDEDYLIAKNYIKMLRQSEFYMI